MEPKNLKGCDKRKRHISIKLHIIYTFSDHVRHPVTKTFTTLHYASPIYISLHYTCRHFTSRHLNFTQMTLHYPLIRLKLI